MDNSNEQTSALLDPNDLIRIDGSNRWTRVHIKFNPEGNFQYAIEARPAEGDVKLAKALLVLANLLVPDPEI